MVDLLRMIAGVSLREEGPFLLRFTVTATGRLKSRLQLRKVCLRRLESLRFRIDAGRFGVIVAVVLFARLFQRRRLEHESADRKR